MVNLRLTLYDFETVPFVEPKTYLLGTKLTCSYKDKCSFKVDLLRKLLYKRGLILKE